MFYSQFILAKKGPLGTIWIAAHLERKLGKNQIADTDIGASVDSILSPEVPIALRLSSHLLLGVVRIYSRKVNYLFNDCSEALLKIKQAFRSTAVDLPPEESTAPYHSITLPETFDLDDFELPDIAFQGHFVDHHVSTKEQITLQVSVDGMGYSTSQFGLDERFGDGDASQIRLDLDEDLFLYNNSSVQHASVQFGLEDGILHQDQPFVPPHSMDVDEGQEGCDRHAISETSKDLSELLSNDYEKTSGSTVGNIRKNDASLRHGYNIQTPDLNEVFLPDNHNEGPSSFLDYTDCSDDDAPSPNSYECSEAPSTPRLTEEAIRASVQEIPALSSQDKTHPSTADPIDHGISTSPQMGIVNLDGTKDNDPTVVLEMGPEPVENAPNSMEVIDAHTSTSSQKIIPSLYGEKSNSPIFGVRTDPESAVNASSTSEAFGPNTSVCHKLEVVSFAVTENNETLSDMIMVTPADNAQVVSSANSILADPRPANVGAECSVEYLDRPDRSQLVCGQESDASLKNGITCNKVDNLPIVLDNGKVVLPAVTSCDGPVPSSCFREASNVEIPLDKPLIHCVAAVGSHNDIVLPEITSGITCCSLINKSDQLIPGVEVPVETCSEFSRREPRGTSEVNYLEEVHHSIGPSVKGQGITLDISDSSFVNKADKLIQDNEVHMGNVVSCHTSAVGSDYFLKPCNSFLNQTNLLPSGLGKSVNTSPEFSHKEPYKVSDATHMGNICHTSGSFSEVQGDNNRTSNAMETTQEVHQKLGSALPGFQTNVCRADEQINDPLLKVVQYDKLNYFSSSHPEPEKMLLAPTGGINLLHDSGQLTAEKSAAKSAGSFDRISSLSGRKRKHHVMDSTPVQQTGSSPKVPGVPRVRRNAANVPDDDDLLASILVGRTPDLRMGATPPLTKISTRKRPRLMHKIGVPKRKVLLDDTLVLHADAIRQQLMNTEDIRRIRKKAPCTRSEIWMLEKRFTAEEIFHESLSMGISASLTSLYCQTYNEKTDFQLGGHHSDEHFSYAQLPKELEHSRSLDFVRESTGTEMAKTGTTMTIEVDGGPSVTFAPGEVNDCRNVIELDVRKESKSCPVDLEHSSDNQTGNLSTIDIRIDGPSVTSVSNEVSICNDAVELGMQEKLESCLPQLEQPSISQAVTVSAMDINVHEIPELEMPSVSAILHGNEHKIPADSVVEDTLLQDSNGPKSPLSKCHVLCTYQEKELVHDLVQPSEKSSEMSEDVFNLIGDASVKGTVSAEEATECGQVDRIALPSVNDGTQAQDAFVTSYVLQEGDIGNRDPRHSHEDVHRIENGETLVSLLDRCLHKDAAGLPIDSDPVGHSKSSLSPMAIDNHELNDLATVKGHQAIEEKKEDELGITLDGESVVQRMSVDEGRHSSETTFSKNLESSYPSQANIEIENIPSAVGENSGMQESNLEGGLDVESASVDLTTRDSSDFCSAVDDNDTEFLNVDDEADFNEEADDNMPNPEEAQSLENSGWSSRTRGVARYLKTLFDDEFGRGRKVVAMDHLLGGKTRKEASRMFFETLVLRTNDYVHVEQEKPFDDINIKPRPKLLKSDFRS